MGYIYNFSYITLRFLRSVNYYYYQNIYILYSYSPFTKWTLKINKIVYANVNLFDLYI